MGTTCAWSYERRKKQRETAREVKPWTKSTGPRTREGKAKASRNAWRHPRQIIEKLEQLEYELAELDEERAFGSDDARADADKAYRALEKRIDQLEQRYRERVNAERRRREHDAGSEYTNSRQSG